MIRSMKLQLTFIVHFKFKVKNFSFFLPLRRVIPTVTPGYLRPLIPETAPEKPDNWTEVMADIERVIMPGVTHWHSPKVVQLKTCLRDENV